MDRKHMLVGIWLAALAVPATMLMMGKKKSGSYASTILDRKFHVATATAIVAAAVATWVLLRRR